MLRRGSNWLLWWLNLRLILAPLLQPHLLLVLLPNQTRRATARLKEELVRKDEHFLQTKDELTRDAAKSYAAGFEDALAQVAYVHPGVDLSQTGLTKTIVDGKLVDAN